MLAVCSRFASFLFAALFRTQTPTCLQSWLHFRTPGKAPKMGPCPSFQDSFPMGEEFGAQIWGPDLGPNFGTQIWAHLAMLFFWLLVCARRACNSPNKYALPKGGRVGCGRDICLMDQSNRSNIFSTVFRDVNLAAATGITGSGLPEGGRPAGLPKGGQRQNLPKEGLPQVGCSRPLFGKPAKLF